MPLIKLQRSALIEALKRLNSYAKEENVILEMCIYGGAAFMLAYNSRTLTKDIDAIVRPKEIAFQLADKVATDMEIHEGWLNDDVWQFVAEKESRIPFGLEELKDCKNLILTRPSASYLLAMKCLACRKPLPGNEGDVEDIAFLVRKMEIHSVEEIQEQINRFFWDRVLNKEAVKRLTEIIKNVWKTKSVST